MTERCIEERTGEWEAAVLAGAPAAVAAQFCDDGLLLGTVSQTIRSGEGIERYFDYFATLPGIEVRERRNHVVSVTDDVAINNAIVDWQWDGADPVTARMTFVYRREPKDDQWCLFELHSSALPEANTGLRRQG